MGEVQNPQKSGKGHTKVTPERVSGVLVSTLSTKPMRLAEAFAPVRATIKTPTISKSAYVEQ
jgi:hypothetical protein